jgi:RNA polymerase sigma-70 factor (ECF subfamily)
VRGKNDLAAYSDEQLVTLLTQGEEHAFDCLYVRYRDQLTTIVFNRLRSREVAEELVQEVFADIWQKRSTLSIRNSFAAYVFTAAKYSVLDYIRSQKVKDRYVSEMLLTVGANEINLTEQQTELDELDHHLNKNIEELPEKCRIVFKLSRFENYSVNEIAIELNISPNTVKYHIAYALKALRLNLRHFCVLIFFIFS